MRCRLLAPHQISQGVHTIEAGGQPRACVRADHMSVRVARGGGGGTNGAHHDALVPCLAALSLAESDPTGTKRKEAHDAVRSRDEQEFYAQAKQVSKVREAARQLAAARAADLEREVEQRREKFLYNPTYASAPLDPKDRKHTDALERQEARMAQQETMQERRSPSPKPMPAPGPAAAGPSAEPPLPSEVYVVEAILDERQRRGKLEYLVKWEGYPWSENSWEPAENVTWGAQDAIHEYQEDRKRYAGVRVTYRNPHGW